MAVETVSLRQHNVVGNKREDSGTFTTSGTTGQVNTTLHWIEHVEIISPNGDGTDIDVDVNLYPNSTSADTTENDAGSFFYSGALASAVYQYRATGW